MAVPLIKVITTSKQHCKQISSNDCTCKQVVSANSILALKE